MSNRQKSFLVSVSYKEVAS